jgi:hypothetical protein
LNKLNKKEEKKVKKILPEIMMGILLSLLLISDVQSIGLTIPEPSKIPKITKQIQSISSESDSKCGTMMILESWKSLTLETQSEIKAISRRPTDPGGGIDGNQHLLPRLYNTTRFILHWTNGSDGGSTEDAVPSQDLDGNGMPDIVEGFAEAFEYVWDFLVNIRGFPAPPGDEAEPNDARNRNPDGRYDVFIYCFGYLGYAYPEKYPNSPSYSYIGVRNTLGSPELRQTVAAHEFFHTIQFVYDCTEESWWLETTATYMEDEVYPDANRNYQYLPFWFEWSDTYGLESTEGLHEYGNFIFAKRLSEDFGDEIIKEIWEEMISTNGLVAIENVLVSKNSSLVDEFSKFVTANFFLEEMYVDGTDYRDFLTGRTTFNGVWIEYQYDASTAPNYFGINSSNVNRDAWVDKWATDYITLKLDPTKPNYRITFDGLDLTTNYLVKLATKKEGLITETIFQLNAQKDGYLDLTYDAFENVTLVIANAGNTATTNPSWRVIITYEVEVTPIYDVAVIDVRPSTYSAVTEQTINIAVTVKNKGNTRDESFNVSTWWSQFLIETKPVINLSPGAERILNIVWTIPTELNDSEIIWANATTVEGESNIENNRFDDGILTITIGIHDLAVINVTPSKTIIGQGQNLNINVTVANQGNYTETFDLTTYANTTVIQTKTVTLENNTSAIIVFTWNITGFAIGNYIISAYAEPVPGETDVDDNLYIGGIIQVIPPVHDIAITDVKSSKTIVGQGFNISINVTVKNQGDYAENFNVTAYANTTIIGTLENFTLTGGSSTTITFLWNTTVFAYGNYTVWAYAHPVPEETDLDDNTFVDGWVIVSILGDVDGDFDVDIYDVVKITGIYGSKVGDPGFNSNSDLDDDGVITIYDVVRCTSHYGQHYP